MARDASESYRPPERPGGARWPLPTVLLTGPSLFAAGAGTVVGPTSVLVLAPVLVTVVAALVMRRRGAWWPALHAQLERHTDALDALPDRHLGWWIALASAAGMLVELVLVRWHASAFQLFAYYKNVSLLAAFLGLGIGYARGTRRPVATPLVLPALALQFGALQPLRFGPLRDQLQNPVAEQFTLAMSAVGTLGHTALSYGLLLTVFTATVLTCIPLGHLAARLMDRRPALVAYGWNLAGGLGGIVLFTWLGRAWTPPSVWLLAAAGVVGPFLVLPGSSRSAIALTAVSVGIALAVHALPLQPEQIDLYSPYQLLSLQVTRDHLPELRVNNVYFQRLVDLSQDPGPDSTRLQRLATLYYGFPYRLKPRPAHVLVVGSGTGNDVAAAIRHDAGQIDAVEIDPAILAYGRAIHPQSPYQDRRVQTIVEDARTFIRRTESHYDLIVYGLLDSHTLLSSRSSVRLDSFVYTVEAFREARARLTPGGLMAVTFCLQSPEHGRKFFLMLQEAFDGVEPRVYRTGYDFGHTFVIGSGLGSAPPDLPFPDVTSEFSTSTLRADVSTDDWPFLYMPVRRYPVSYVAMLLVLLAASALILRQLLPTATGTLPTTPFFLGAGFMLVETKGITELALTFGTTWQVLSAVIAGVLLMAFLANALVMRTGPLPTGLVYGALAASLVLGLLLSGSGFAGVPPMLGRVMATTVVTVPLFFSGLAFSVALRLGGDAPAALASNLLGAMLGGLLEYNAMYLGFRSLYVFALALYGLAFVSALRARPA